MNYIFLDMEWNQPNGKANTVMSTVPLHGEIIRIGAVKSADGTTLSDKFYSCIIPRYYKKMNHAVGRVTGLGTAAMTYGVKFTLAYEQFLEWCGEDCIILTWGGEDEKILEANLAVHGMDMKAHPKFYDLQAIFARRILCDGKQHSLQSAVEHYGIEMNLRAHDALNDAYYAACVGLKMGFADYLTQYDDMIAEAERIRSEKFFRTYQNIRSASEAMYGRRIRTCRCPVCRRLMKTGKWIRTAQNIAINCAECSEHGEYSARIKVTPCPDGSFSATRRFVRLTAEFRESYEKALAENVSEINSEN